MLVISLDGVVWQILTWYVPAALCYVAWPVIRRKRAYIVVAAVLCLTPSFASYEFLDQWPEHFGYADWLAPVTALVAGVPSVLMRLPGSLASLAFMTLPAGVVVGISAWLLSPRLMALRGGGRAMPPGRIGGHVWLRRLGDLVLLLVAVMAYAQLLHMPLLRMARFWP